MKKMTSNPRGYTQVWEQESFHEVQLNIENEKLRNKCQQNNSVVLLRVSSLTDSRSVMENKLEECFLGAE